MSEQTQTTAPIVVAHALLRSQAVAAVAAHFHGAGFAILGTPGITIGISGPKDLFERHFGIVLVLGADHAYTVHAGSSRSGRPIDPTLIPNDLLPPPIRQAISQIALDASASIDQQPGVLS